MTDKETPVISRYENLESGNSSQKETKDKNLEPGNSNQKETKNENRKPENSMIVKFFLNAWESNRRRWHVIFLISCVIGVLIDPLFLYIPIINEDEKCLRRDETMKNVALILRSFTDFVYLLHIIVEFALTKAKKHKLSIWKGFPWWYHLTDILAILPFPQVVVVVFFSKMAGSKSLVSSTLNILLLAQYVPRIIRIYLSAKDLINEFDSLNRRLLLKVAFNFFLYIIVGHVFGAFWYFYSIFRETACWHRACNNQNGCHSDSSFYCQSNYISTKNLTYFNQFCPVNPPNSTVYNFGIFVNAIESGTLGKTNFLRKISMYFWWGLRNLSSLGSNLETSSDFLENLFAVLISMSGLLLFLSLLVGNLQIYLQLASTEAEKERQMSIAIEHKIGSYLSNYGYPDKKVDAIIRYIPRIIRKGKVDLNDLFSLLGEVERVEDLKQLEHVAEIVTRMINGEKLEKKTNRSIELDKWMSVNGIPDNMKQEIMHYMQLRLQEDKDVDVVNILGVLPYSLVEFVREHLCSDTLKKVPMFKITSKLGYEIICRYLKPVTYSENTYIIQKGEPLDMMFFITQGIVWSFNETSMEKRLQKGDYFGEELLKWELKNSKPDIITFPISTKNVKAHTKVEAFALKAANIEQVLNDFKWIFSLDTGDEDLLDFLATRLQRRYRIHRTNKHREEKNAKE